MSANKIVPNKLFLSEVCDMLETGKHVKLRPKGKSMFPFIDERKDTLILTPPTGMPKKGDIVLAITKDEQYVVHRIVGTQGNELTLMGDSNLAGKERCTPQDVKGVVSAIVRKGKRRNMDAFSYKASVKFWIWLLPIRRYLLYVIRKL